MPRVYGAEPQARPLLAWLNVGSPSKLRILGGNRAHERREILTSRARVTKLVSLLLRLDEPSSPLAKRCILRDEVNALLKRYQFTPTVDIGKPAEVGEQGAVQQVLALFERHYLGNVKACARCGTWFYAKVSHARFCRRTCQQMHFRTSDEFKAHKRRYMRELRKGAKRAV